MNYFKNSKIIALIVVLVLFTIIYFVAVNKVSYAFEYSKYDKDAYNSLINTIKECAKQYAINNPNIINEDNIVYITIQDLIDLNFIIPNDNENVVNPIDNSIMNSMVIKIKKDDNNNYEVEI